MLKILNVLDLPLLNTDKAIISKYEDYYPFIIVKNNRI